MKDNDQILTIYLYSYPHIRININDIYDTIVPSVHQKIRMQRWRAREITIQCEQYGVTVHLFIGPGRSPDKITFIPLTFTLSYNTSYQGLSSLFPLRSVSSSIQAEAPWAIASASIHVTFRVVYSYHTPLSRENFHPKAEASCNSLYRTENKWLVTLLRTFGRGRPPTTIIVGNRFNGDITI